VGVVLNLPKAVAVLASKLDPAGMNIASHLLPKLRGMSSKGGDRASRAKVVLLDEDLVSADGFPESLSPRPDLAIFASRHESESGRPCLTVHPPGNIGESLHGGRSRHLSMASPLEMKEALRALKALNYDTRFEVTLEATHHGPLTEVPSFFIEIGSSPSDWINEPAGEVLAKAILCVIDHPIRTVPVAVGFGGPHYSPGFTELVLNTEFSISHVVPKHQVGAVDDAMLGMLFERSSPRATIAVLDWKGIRGEERRGLLVSMDRAGFRHARLRDCLCGRALPSNG